MTSTQTIVVLFGAPDGTGSMKMMHSYVLALRHAGYPVTLMHGDRIRGGREAIPPAGRNLLDGLAGAGVDLVETDAFRSGRQRPAREVRALCAELDASAVIAFHQTDRAYARAAQSSSVAAILCIQNLHNFHGPTLVKRVKEALYKRVVGRVDFMIASSAAVDAELRSRFAVPAHKIAVIPNAIDVAGFADPTPRARERIRSEYELDDEDLMLLNVGRVDPQKGQLDLIDAMERGELDHAHAFVAGGSSAGSETDEYFDRVSERANSGPRASQITLLGWRDDVRDLLDACDVYVHPSIWEGWPLAIVEAMAAAKPVVLSDCVGRPIGFVDDVHGEVVPAGDSEALAAALARVAARTPEDRDKMGRACRELALANYDLASASRAFLASIAEVLA